MRTEKLLSMVFDAQGWRVARRDLVNGFISSVRLCVGAVGVATLAAAVALIAWPATRAVLAGVLPEAAAQPISAAAVASVAGPAVAAASEEAAADDDADQPPVVLEPRLEHVANYLARRYRVADESVRDVVAAAKAAGDENHVDPLLVLAVVAVESGMNPVAQSPLGARGLMQVMTKVHADRFEDEGGDEAALEPETNIKVGTAILGELIRRGGSVDRGLQLYVGAGLNGDGNFYAVRVRAELQRLRMAASGRVDAALVSAAPHADARIAVPAVAPARAPEASADPSERS
jgi:soluble lytic murein transglycosylase-like protein